MAIVTLNSRIFSIIAGEHRGKRCVIYGFVDTPGAIAVILDEGNCNQMAVVKRMELTQLETPGWPDQTYYRPYGLHDHFMEHQGDGANMLRTNVLAQPRALKARDPLATLEVVLEDPRRGYNSSTLIHLNSTGWVELAPRLPIALFGNKNYKLPDKLCWGEKLATGCRVIKKAKRLCPDWTQIVLDRGTCKIEVPACIPLALA